MKKNIIQAPSPEIKRKNRFIIKFVPHNKNKKDKEIIIDSWTIQACSFTRFFTGELKGGFPGTQGSIDLTLYDPEIPCISQKIQELSKNIQKFYLVLEELNHEGTKIGSYSFSNLQIVCSHHYYSYNDSDALTIGVQIQFKESVCLF